MVMLIITCATCVGSLIYSMVVHYTPQNTSHSMLIKLYENENTVYPHHGAHDCMAE